jgi:hypothetical protein
VHLSQNGMFWWFDVRKKKTYVARKKILLDMPSRWPIETKPNLIVLTLGGLRDRLLYYFFIMVNAGSGQKRSHLSLTFVTHLPFTDWCYPLHGNA